MTRFEQSNFATLLDIPGLSPAERALAERHLAAKGMPAFADELEQIIASHEGEQPVVETPVFETPVVETPVFETPVVETPVFETPVVETPVVETPVVEQPAETVA